MQHRTPRSPSGTSRSAATRRPQRLARWSGRLLVAAVVLAVAAAALLALPRLTGSAAPASVAAQDAAAQKRLQATGHRTGTAWHAQDAAATAGTGAAAGRGAAGRHHGDHRRQTAQPADAPNANCTLIVPAAPTGAAGLATPYQLTATDRAAGPCHEANADQSAFVEAAVYDPAQHSVSIYHPLVVDAGDRPAVPPTAVSLPAGAVVGVWFGYNGDTLTLGGPGARSCVNGLPGSPFGQFAYCNAPAFFTAANGDATLQGKIPGLGTAADGQPCPTSRDFSVVDQDQSDNLATAYRIIRGRMAQVTADTAGRGTPLTNGSDEGLVAKFIDPALGCTPFTGEDLNHPGTQTPALALNELSAAKNKAVALVPTNDPMVLVDDRTSVRKTNLYRAGVDQPPLPAGQTPKAYCAGIASVAPARLLGNADRLAVATSPTPDQPDLLAFLKDRLTTTMQNLDCPQADRVAAVLGVAAPSKAADAADAAAANADTPKGDAAGTADTAATSTAAQAPAAQGAGRQGTGTQGTGTQGTGTGTTGTGTTGTGTTGGRTGSRAGSPTSAAPTSTGRHTTAPGAPATSSAAPAPDAPATGGAGSGGAPAAAPSATQAADAPASAAGN